MRYRVWVVRKEVAPTNELAQKKVARKRERKKGRARLTSYGVSSRVHKQDRQRHLPARSPPVMNDDDDNDNDDNEIYM